MKTSKFKPEFKIFKTGTTAEMITISSKTNEQFNRTEKIKKYIALGYSVYNLNNTPIFN
jgi:hypothetical protein